MLLRRKTSKRNLKPFQRGYKDEGSVLTVADIVLMIVLVAMFGFIIYGIINTIRI